MSDASKLEYSELDYKWKVDKQQGVFVSQPHESFSDLRIIFSEPFRDGAVSSEIVVRESSTDARDGCLIFRYRDPSNYYNAGLGGYGNKYFIGKMENGVGQTISASGKSQWVERNSKYLITVRASGNRIELSQNGIVHLRAFDNAFSSGLWGLHAFKGEVEFRNPRAETVTPDCFVIMPFTTQLDIIYEIVEETVYAFGFKCLRGDRSYIAGPIMDEVADSIERSDLLIADITNHNPNVFYEIGYAHALRKPIILISQSVTDLPFDVRHLRVISYNTSIRADRKLSFQLGEAIKATTGYVQIASNSNSDRAG